MALAIHEILHSLTDERDLSVADVAHLCDIPDSTVRGIISRKQKSIALEVAFKLSKGLHISLATLNGEKESQMQVSDAEMRHIKKYRTLDEYGKEMVDAALDIESRRREEALARQQAEEAAVGYDLPSPAENIIEIRFYPQTASAGYGEWLDEMDSYTIQVPDTPTTRRADFCLKVSGDSMEPRYFDGDLVFVKEQEDVEVGEYGIWIVDGYAYLKKRGEDTLISINPNYDDIEQGEDVRCVGKVIGKM